MSSITTYGVIAEMRLSALGTRNAGTPLACVLPLQGHRAGLPSFFSGYFTLQKWFRRVWFTEAFN